MSCFVVREGERGEGVAQEFLKSSMGGYKKMGIEKLGVDVVTKGEGYIWLRYGFTPDEDEIGKLKKAMLVKYDKKIKSQWKSLPSAVKADIKTYLDKLEKGIDFWRLASVKFISNDGKKTFIGKQLLSGEKWHGSLFLNDKVAMKKFDTYIDTNSKAYLERLEWEKALKGRLVDNDKLDELRALAKTPDKLKKKNPDLYKRVIDGDTPAARNEAIDEAVKELKPVNYSTEIPYDESLKDIDWLTPNPDYPEEYLDSLTEEMKDRLDTYMYWKHPIKDYGYYDIQYIKMGRKFPDMDLIDLDENIALKAKGAVNIIDSAFRVSKTRKDLQLYRFTIARKSNWLNAKVGDVVEGSNGGYVSTAIKVKPLAVKLFTEGSEKNTPKVMLVINAKKGQKAIQLNQVDPVDIEETLLPAGTKFRVKSIEDLKDTDFNKTLKYKGKDPFKVIEVDIVYEVTEQAAEKAAKVEVVKGAVKEVSEKIDDLFIAPNGERMVNNSGVDGYVDALSEGMKEELQNYKHLHYKTLNYYKRTGTVEEGSHKDLLAGVEKVSKIIDEAFDYSRMSKDSVLYRYAVLRGKMNWKNAKVGDVIEDAAYVSTSRKSDDRIINMFADGSSEDNPAMELIIKARAGQRAIEMEHIWKIHDEAETLLPAGTKFKIISRTELDPKKLDKKYSSIEGSLIRFEVEIVEDVIEDGAAVKRLAESPIITKNKDNLIPVLRGVVDDKKEWKRITKPLSSSDRSALKKGIGENKLDKVNKIVDKMAVEKQNEFWKVPADKLEEAAKQGGFINQSILGKDIKIQKGVFDEGSDFVVSVSKNDPNKMKIKFYERSGYTIDISVDRGSKIAYIEGLNFPGEGASLARDDLTKFLENSVDALKDAGINTLRIRSNKPDMLGSLFYEGKKWGLGVAITESLKTYMRLRAAGDYIWKASYYKNVSKDTRDSIQNAINKNKFDQVIKIVNKKFDPTAKAKFWREMVVDEFDLNLTKNRDVNNFKKNFIGSARDGDPVEGFTGIRYEESDYAIDYFSAFSANEKFELEAYKQTFSNIQNYGYQEIQAVKRGLPIPYDSPSHTHWKSKLALKKRIEETIKTIDGSFDHSVLTADSILYRYTVARKSSPWRDVKVGDIVEPKGYTSTTRDPENDLWETFTEGADENNLPVYIEINVKKGQRAIDMESVFELGEDETLLPARTRFRVTSLEKRTDPIGRDSIFIEADIVEGDDYFSAILNDGG